jgi:hypothetical protein
MKRNFVLPILALVALSALGCGSDSTKPESIASPERVTQIVDMRKLFDKAKGNWDSMSATDKDQFTKLAGDEKTAKSMWESMARGGGPQAGPK